MNFVETSLPGAFVVDIERMEDVRGFFARTFCEREFERHGIEPRFVQCNVSFNRIQGTVRGLHYQKAPHEEAKLVRCTTGAIWDVIVDIRRSSVTYAQWYAVELSAENRRALYIPPGFAHGFQTLTDGAEVYYQMSAPYESGAKAGISVIDPSLAIDWPLPISMLSTEDAQLPTLVLNQ